MKNNGHEVSKKKVCAKERIIYWQTATSWNSVNEPKNIQVKSIADWTKSIKFLCSGEFSTFLLDVLFSRQLALCVLIAEIYNDGKYCDKNSGNLEEKKHSRPVATEYRHSIENERNCAPDVRTKWNN